MRVPCLCTLSLHLYALHHRVPRVRLCVSRHKPSRSTHHLSISEATQGVHFRCSTLRRVFAARARLLDKGRQCGEDWDKCALGMQPAAPAHPQVLDSQDMWHFHCDPSTLRMLLNALRIYTRIDVLWGESPQRSPSVPCPPM